MLIISRSMLGKTSELILMIEIAPLTMMRTIRRLAATEFVANHEIIPFTKWPHARCC